MSNQAAHADLLGEETESRAPAPQPAVRRPRRVAGELEKVAAACAARIEAMSASFEDAQAAIADAVDASAQGGDCWLVAAEEPEGLVIRVHTVRFKVIDALARSKALWVLNVAAIRRAALA